MAGNSFLAEYAGRYNGRVSVVPTTIDTDAYRPSTRAPNRTPVIGWTGSRTTAPYLEIIRPALERLRRRTEFKLVVVGADGFAPRGVEVEHRPWRSSTEVQDLTDIDVGVMPLADTEWERGKCALKALQYMALGVPPVVSPVGANRQVVEDGVSGRFAESSEEWETTLHLLLTEPGLRARLGRAARARVEASFSCRVQVPRVATVFREVAP
jgi:glycosyltransferase involved in cell wall biosynthesis